MERISGKTNDAYVEFVTMEDAMNVVQRHDPNYGRLPRLGDRAIEMELSSQAAMMRDLFPLARGLYWDGGFPVLQPGPANEPWNTFKGFISFEPCW